MMKSASIHPSILGLGKFFFYFSTRWKWPKSNPIRSQRLVGWLVVWIFCIINFFFILFNLALIIFQHSLNNKLTFDLIWSNGGKTKCHLHKKHPEEIKFAICYLVLISTDVVALFDVRSIDFNEFSFSFPFRFFVCFFE